MKSFDPLFFRQQFPAINTETLYLDSAATTLKPNCVIQLTDEYYRHSSATVHRSQHQQAQNMTRRYETTRQQVASLLNAPTAEQIIWTRGATESLNLVAQSYARPRLQPDDEILVSMAEHHANLLPWLIVAQQTGAKIVPLPLNENHIPDISRLPDLLNERTKILALGHMSNVTGGTPDLKNAIRLAHQYSCVVVVDGAQAIAHTSVDVIDLDIDFYAFSAHKLYGPTGVGVLYGKMSLLESMDPWMGGGKMLTDVSFNHFTPAAIPQRFEAGTPNIAGVIGFSATLDWLSTVDRAAAENYACSLTTLAEQNLQVLPGFRSFRQGNSSILSFDIAGIHHSDLVTLLSEQGIALRAGQHCAQPLIEALGVTGTLRASFSPYNTADDVERFCSALRVALTLLSDDELI